MIYLDNAATTGQKPYAVIKAVNNALKYHSANPGRGGHRLSVKSAMKIYSVREEVSKYFSVDSPDKVCFTASCTASLNTVLNGCLREKDHIIISSFEHNAVLRPIYGLSINKNIEYSVVSLPVESERITAEHFERYIKKNTKMILVTHSSNVTGTVLPIKEIGRLCKNHGLLFCVDAAQSAGHMKIDMKAMNIDYLCVAPHKGLYAPMGTGILICRKEIDDVLIKGGTGVNSVSPLQPDSFPERIESGTLNLPGIFGIEAGIDFIKNENVKNRIINERKLMHMYYNELKRLGAVLYTSDPLEDNYTSVLSFNIKNHSSEEVAAFLSERGICVRAGLHCSPLAHETLKTLEGGTVRISASVFNREDEVEKVVFALKKIKKSY